MSVVELVSRSVQGKTSPWLAKLDDDKYYYIKGKEALCRGLVIEYICAELGRLLGLPVPPSKIAYLDRNLLQYNDEAIDDFGNEDCDVFASQKVDNVVDIRFSDLSHVTVDEAKLIFFFDYLIANEDRTLGENGGNPNLCIDPMTKKLAVIDHNLAFDVNFNFQNNKEHHIFCTLWYCPQRDLHFINMLKEKLPEVINTLRNCVSDIPEDWLENAPDLITEIFNRLELYKDDYFWEALQ
jgi:hypothetical protein